MTTVPALVLVFASSFGATMSFYLLLSVVPLYATSIGASGIGAGLTTGALMLATVAAELFTPGLVARFGYRLVYAGGMILLGAPALALIVSGSMSAILAVSLVRGIGFAIAVVVGSSLVAMLVPPERHGEGLGVYGIVVGVPAVVGLPLGVWLAAHAGYSTVFVIAAATALAGLIAVPGIPARAPSAASVSVLTALKSPALLRPAVVFATTAMAAGAVVTFLPLAVPAAALSGNLAASALLAQAAAATATRWWAGRYGSTKLLIPAVVVSAVGVAALVLAQSPVAVIAAMILFGAGFGVAQNTSLTLMFARVSPSGYDAVSAVWNLGYDAGLGVGGAGCGVLAARMGYPLAFAFTGALMLAITLLAWRRA